MSTRMQRGAAASVAALCTMSFAGPLDPPPGPISSTHKTLTQVEPRIAINAVNTPGDADSLFRITAPGSYYLTGNVSGVSGKSGIEIDIEGKIPGSVSIDLMGFTMLGGAGSANGCSIANGLTDMVSVANGSITGWSGAGVSAVRSVLLSGLSIDSDSPTGCVSLAHPPTSSSRITDCTIRTTEGPAIVSSGALEMRGSTIVAEGCTTTACVDLSDLTLLLTTFRVSNSSFSTAVCRLANGNTLLRDVHIEASDVDAPSLILIADSGNHRIVGLNASTIGCTFSGPVISLANVVDLADLSLVLTGTSAPVAVETGGNNSLMDLAILLSPSTPVGLRLLGVNNAVEHLNVRSVPAGGFGVVMLANGNTLLRSRIAGSGAGSITGVQIGAAATNNAILSNEFTRLMAGLPVDNLGGATNGVGPLVTSANLGAATNPFSNYLH